MVQGYTHVDVVGSINVRKSNTATRQYNFCDLWTLNLQVVWCIVLLGVSCAALC